MIRYLLVSLIFVSLTHSPMFASGNAAAAATPAPKGDYDRKSTAAQSASSCTSHSSEVVECDTSTGKKLLTTPPEYEELEKSRAAARQAPSAAHALMALCAPYARHNPDIFALTVFKEWLDINSRRGWFRCPKDKTSGKSTSMDIVSDDLEGIGYATVAAQLHSIFWCCLGIADAYEDSITAFESSGLMSTISKARKAHAPAVHYSHALGYHNTPFAHIEQANKEYWDTREESSHVAAYIVDQTPIPREVAQVITGYCFKTQFGNSIEDIQEQDTKNNRVIISHGGLADQEDYNPEQREWRGDNRLISDLRGLATIGFRECNLRNNLIAIINPDDLRSCRPIELRLASNRITSWPAGAFANLESLELDKNPITRLSKDMFAGCNLLRELLISGCAIETVQDQTFVQMPRLRTVWMKGNKLTALPPDFGIMAGRLEVVDALSRLYLDGNPFLQSPVEKEKYDKLKAQVAQNNQELDQALMRAARQYALAAPTSANSDSAGPD